GHEARREDRYGAPRPPRGTGARAACAEAPDAGGEGGAGRSKAKPGPLSLHARGRGWRGATHLDFRRRETSGNFAAARGGSVASGEIRGSGIGSPNRLGGM